MYLITYQAINTIAAETSASVVVEASTRTRLSNVSLPPSNAAPTMVTIPTS